MIEQIKQDNYNKELNECQMEAYIEKLFPDPEKGKNIKKRIKEAGAISSYQNQTERPIVKLENIEIADAIWLIQCLGLNK